MRLIKPTKKYSQTWYKMLQELDAEKTEGFWDLPERAKNIDEYIQRVQDYAKNRNVPDFLVPSITFWLTDKERLIGFANIRPKLTEKLHLWGGHVGYVIRPIERNKGYGTKILALTLKKVKKMGFEKVLITCLDSNLGSQKIIEKNKGQLQDIIQNDVGLTRRYWINLAETV